MLGTNLKPHVWKSVFESGKYAAAMAYKYPEGSHRKVYPHSDSPVGYGGTPLKAVQDLVDKLGHTSGSH